MGIEIERKFLVDHDKWRAFAKPEGKYYRQGYIFSDPTRTVRVRIANGCGYLTLKGGRQGKMSRSEFEYEIPVADAEEMLNTLAQNGTEKTRYCIPAGDFVWEVDEFAGDNEGLIVAEIELDNEEDEFDIPEWITEEVTEDHRYANSSLAVHPFKDWTNK
jgi:CYTH domain-containing protein